MKLRCIKVVFFTHHNKVMIPHPAVLVLEEEQEASLYIYYTIEILPPISQ